MYDVPIEEVIYIWKRVLLRVDRDGKLIYQIDKITENVPADAFSKGVRPSWIE